MIPDKKAIIISHHLRLILGKNSLRYTGAVLWNEILKVGLNSETSDYSFSKGLKSVLLDNLL